MHCYGRYIRRVWHLSCLGVFCGDAVSASHSLMSAEKQQKQMELPVGLWEDSGRARTPVVGGSSYHVVVCLLCPLVISARPVWWSSRRSLACQLSLGPQSTLKVHPSPRASIFLPSPFLHLNSFFILCILLCSHFLTAKN